LNVYSSYILDGMLSRKATVLTHTHHYRDNLGKQASGRFPR
jgi:hypothetical protein